MNNSNDSKVRKWEQMSDFDRWELVFNWIENKQAALDELIDDVRKTNKRLNELEMQLMLRVFAKLKDEECDNDI